MLNKFKKSIKNCIQIDNKYDIDLDNVEYLLDA